MSNFFTSPFSIPIAALALAAIAIVTGALVKIANARSSGRENAGAVDDLQSQVDRLRERVESLESIVVNLDNRMNR